MYSSVKVRIAEETEINLKLKTITFSPFKLKIKVFTKELRSFPRIISTFSKIYGKYITLAYFQLDYNRTEFPCF